MKSKGRSTGSDAIHFNVYIFNVENGITLNYAMVLVELINNDEPESIEKIDSGF